MKILHKADGLKFLPTPSHGGRPKGLKPSSSSIYFYPRPHMEGDAQIGPADRVVALISTHALTWRATV